ncbi:unnamed protein product [Gongylonema pulchrum]|uniref:MSP domain-containing protein n=1 Tax=Gongylonema pulchrum TaxID=637853 RepID=A0A183ERL7_9BILA|nr:unnamed protein product [Gongylonema pulchrum]
MHDYAGFPTNEPGFRRVFCRWTAEGQAKAQQKLCLNNVNGDYVFFRVSMRRGESIDGGNDQQQGQRTETTMHRA